MGLKHQKDLFLMWDLTQPDEELKKMLFACVDRIDEIKSIV